ncbi:MAG: aspartate--tRNA ligase [candidate division WOR-3 bacterium]
MIRTHTCGELSEKHIGQKVVLAGWVRRIRDLGGVLFIDLRDRYGRTQLIIEPSNTSVFEKTKSLGLYYVVKVEGIVRKRPDDMINPEIPTGSIEVEVKDLEILNTTPPLPFLPEDEVKIQEETRLSWRFLDLRRPCMQRNIIFRHNLLQLVRNYLSEKGFLEIETPFLTKSTPEGARDFIVPSRNFPGKFYALPQSPQLYKQILMSSGFDRYFQIVRCFRDEDLRQDRQPEFTQIDIEMSFPDVEDIFSLIEELFKKIFKDLLNKELETPFPRMSYHEVMTKYGSDKPDLRIREEIIDLTEVFANTENEILRKTVKEGGKILALRSDSDFSRKEIENLRELLRKDGAEGLMYFKSINGQFSGQLGKFLPIDAKLADGFYFVIAGPNKYKTYSFLGKLRNIICKPYTNDYKFLWVFDFPLFEWNEEYQRIEPCHHMFTQPKEEHIPILESDPLKVIGKQYDLVLNGTEIASGSIRNHNADLQRKIMKIIGLDNERVERNFGFLLKALEYGAPPHGGIALGFDRIVAMLLGLESIRDCIAFPKTTSGQALYEMAPNEVDPELLKELHIDVKNA